MTDSRLTPQDLSGLLRMPLSAEQLAAATAPLGPQLIVAGAGTGKTTVMAARVTWLVATGQVRPDAVLGLTFTNKAAGELRTRIRRALAQVARVSRHGLARHTADRGADGLRNAEAAVMTYHSFAGQLLNEFGLLLGVDTGATPLTDGLRARLAHRVACSSDVPAEQLSALASSGPGLLGLQILKLDDALADLGVETGELVEFDQELRSLIAEDTGAASLIGRIDASASGRLILARLVDQFRELKRVEGVQDFADQVRYGHALAADSRFVSPVLQDRYQVVLLDEYQDTSRAQRRTMQLLFGGGHPVTAVGDPCQAIYGWRGASSTNIDGFPEHFPQKQGAPATCYPLTVNRRSDSAVIEVANRISAGLQRAHDQISPLQPAVEAGPGQLRCALLETQDEEVAWVSDEIVALCEARDPGDIAVLCRTNAQIGEVASALADRGVPLQIAAKQPLFLMPQVQEVIRVLRLLVEPDANAALLGVLMGPHFRIGPLDLALLRKRAKQIGRTAEVEAVEPEGVEPEATLLDALFDPGRQPYSSEARQRFGEVRQLINQLLAVRMRPVREVIERTLALLGLPALWGEDEMGAADRAAMAEFIGFAQDFEGLDGGRALSDFLNYIDDCDRFEMQPTVELPAAAGRVCLMTIHGSKGLEFPVVALPFLSSQVFPASRGRSRWPTSATSVPQLIAGEPDPAQQVNFPACGITTKSHRAYVEAAKESEALDEDRLAYVAVTRAEQSLIASGHWWGPTQVKPRGPSRYLLALKAVCEAGDGDLAEWAPPPDAEAVSPCLTSPARSVLWPNPTVSLEAQRIATEVVAGVADRGEPSTPADSPAASKTESGAVVQAQGSRPHSADDAEAQLEADQLDPDRWEERVSALLTHLKGAPNKVTLPETMSVSDTITWQADPKAFEERLLRPMPRAPSQAAAAGTAFHEWVERRLGQQELFAPDGSGGFLDATNIEESVAGNFSPKLMEMFARTEFADRAPVAVEHPFTVNIAGLTITGKIDAVFETQDGFQVVDWKTGSKSRSDPNQLALYRYAWAQVADVPLGRVAAAFVFLPTAEVVWYSDLPDPVELLDQGRLGSAGLAGSGLT